jgi:hypothetical protein
MGLGQRCRAGRGGPGGSLTEVRAAARLALLGLPVWRFLTTRDGSERALLLAVSEEADRLSYELEKRLATHIANAFVRAKLHG